MDRIIIVELAVFGAGLCIYSEETHAKDSVGRYGLWSFVALLLIAWVSTLFAGAPPSVNALAAGAFVCKEKGHIFFVRFADIEWAEAATEAA